MMNWHLLLTGVAIAIAAVFVGFAVITVAASIRAASADRRRTAARERIRTQLFERVSRDEPEWETWVETLSDRERRQLISVVDRYLRTVRGDEREAYLAVARALNMGEQADAALDKSETLPRLKALSRLTLLDYPISERRLLETCLDDPRIREAAARLLYERREEFERPRALGTVLLVWDGREPLSARGVETLYDLNRANPVVLLSQGRFSSYRWETPVLVQVCTVLGSCRTPARYERFEWALWLFDHEDPTVRAAAIELFEGLGWRSDLRAAIPFRQLVTDEDSRVRRATYRTLAQWGDQHAHHLLEWAVVDEDDPRAQLDAVRALASLDGNPDRDQPGWPNETWAWVRAERDIGNPVLETRGLLA